MTTSIISKFQLENNLSQNEKYAFIHYKIPEKTFCERRETRLIFFCMYLWIYNDRVSPADRFIIISKIRGIIKLLLQTYFLIHSFFLRYRKCKENGGRKMGKKEKWKAI